MILLKVNGKRYEAEVSPDTPLLWVIRENLGLTGTKYGCGIARCPADLERIPPFFRRPEVVCYDCLHGHNDHWNGIHSRRTYNTNPPFRLTLLAPVKLKAGNAGKEETVYAPKNPYNIFINYELGMHCVGFEMSYCCGSHSLRA